MNYSSFNYAGCRRILADVDRGRLGDRRAAVSKRRRSFSDDRRTLSWFLWQRRAEQCDDHVTECGTDTVSNSEAATALPCSHLLPLQPGSYVCYTLYNVHLSIHMYSNVTHYAVIHATV